jgi:hypothetical protein
MHAPLLGAGVSPFPPNPDPSSVDLANRSKSPCRGTSLEDHSALVNRQAAEIYRRGTIALDVHTLEEALTRVEDRLARRLIALSDSLGKWDSLEFLIRQTLSESIERAECAADQIDRWILAANKRFTAPTSSQVQRLVRLSQDARLRHSERDWRSLEIDLAAFM